MLAAAPHLLLALLQQVQHCSVGREFGINGQRFNRHAHRVAVAFVRAAVINGCEQAFLLVVELSQQEGIGRREQRALVDAVALAIVLNASHVECHAAKQIVLAVLGLLQIGHKLGESIAAVEVGRIPAFALVKGRRLAQLGLGLSNLHDRHFLGLDLYSTVSLVDVLQNNLHRCAIDNDVVIVQKEVIILLIPQQVDVEQASAFQVKRLDEAGLFLLDVSNILDVKCPLFLFQVQCLNGVPIVVQLDACEQCGMSHKGCANSLEQPVAVERAVKNIYIGQIVKRLLLVARTFHEDAELRRR